MNMSLQTTNIHVEKAIRFLVKYMPPSEEDSRKPILFHDIRVGVYLYNNGYAEDVVLAGVLHDAIEWTAASEQMVREEFGERVTGVILACSKNDAIADKEEKIKEMIGRCVAVGQDALIVKAADILDSFTWYASQNNKTELLYCMRNANAIFELKPDHFNDKIFDEINMWREKYLYLVK